MTSSFADSPEKIERPRRVLFVTNTAVFGGAEKHLLDLINRLNPARAQSVVLCTGQDPFTARLDQDQTARVITCLCSSEWSWRWLWLFLKIKPSVVVFVHGVFSSFGGFPYLAAKLVGSPRLCAIHHLIAPPFPEKITGLSISKVAKRLAGWRTRHLLGARISAALSDVTISVSHAVRDRLVNDYGYSASKAVVIHNGVDVSHFTPDTTDRNLVRKRLGIGSKDAVLVCVARLNPMKGLDILLATVAQLLAEGLEFRCLIVGEGPLKQELTEKITALGLSQRVHLLGFQQDVRPYLRAADIFVLTSYREGLPLAILEAMACGLPCVVTDVGGNAEAVMDQQDGFVVNSGSVAELTKALSHLLTQPAARTTMSQLARRSACERFDLGIRMRELEDVILGSDRPRVLDEPGK